jgi:adenylate kinase
VCVDCGSNFSVETPPRYGWSCDNCGGEIIQRQDDTPAAIKHRLDEYEDKTAPLIEWYSDRDMLEVVDGQGKLDEVTQRVVASIESRRSV